MRQLHIVRALLVILACSVVLAGALACRDGDEEKEDELARIDGIATNNLVELEVMQVRFAQAEETNAALSDRVAALEEENRQLKHRLSVLEELGSSIAAGAAAAMAGAGATDAAPSGLGAAYDAASEEDRQLVRDFLECAMKASGTDEATIAAMLPESEKMTWRDIEAGDSSIEQLQLMRNIVCPN